MVRRIAHFAEPILPWLTLVGMLAALAMVFLYVPTERDQGVVQRIFYFHVPSAWISFIAFFTVAAASTLFLWRDSRTWDLLAHAAAEVGMLFCSFVLVTGPLWARPIWGTWWTWDPRLTMTVILWTIYAAYLMLRAFGGAEEAVARYAAVLGIIGILDIPIIIISVRLWRGIHPAVLMTREGSSGLTDPAMRATLFTALGAFFLIFLWLLWLRYRTLRLRDEVNGLHRLLF